MKAHENKHVRLHVLVPRELPFSSAKAVCKKEDFAKWISDNDTQVAHLMPSSCRCSLFEVSYYAKIKVKHATLFNKFKDSEKFHLNFYQCPLDATTIKRCDSFDEVDLPGQQKQQSLVAEASLGVHI